MCFRSSASWLPILLLISFLTNSLFKNLSEDDAWDCVIPRDLTCQKFLILSWGRFQVSYLQVNAFVFRRCLAIFRSFNDSEAAHNFTRKPFRPVDRSKKWHWCYVTSEACTVADWLGANAAVVSRVPLSRLPIHYSRCQKYTTSSKPRFKNLQTFSMFLKPQ